LRHVLNSAARFDHVSRVLLSMKMFINAINDRLI
jgi:hypothetical protein